MWHLYQQWLYVRKWLIDNLSMKQKDIIFKWAMLGYVGYFSWNLVWTVPSNTGVLNPFPFLFLSALCQHYLEPPVKLCEALERYGLKTEDFFVLKHGESRHLNTDDEDVE